MSITDKRPSCAACGKRLYMVRMPFTVDKKTELMVRYVCICGHKTGWMSEGQLKQARRMPEVM